MSRALGILAHRDLDVDEYKFVMIVVTANGVSWRMAIAQDAVPAVDWSFYMRQAISRVLR